jgi:hypothetical protein
MGAATDVQRRHKEASKMMPENHTTNMRARRHNPKMKKTRKQNLDVALALACAGLSVFPCRPDKTPLVKWRDAATSDCAQIKRWWMKFPDAVPGLPTGAVNGVAVLDLDAKDGKDGIAAAQALGLNPDTASDFVVRTPSGGLHLYFQYRDGLRVSASEIAPGIDVRGEGGYVVAPGAVSVRGAYEPHGDLADARLVGLPVWPANMTSEPRRETGEVADIIPDVDRTKLAEMLRYVDPGRSHDDWTQKLMAIHHASKGAEWGLAIAQGWSATDERYRRAEVEAKWKSFTVRDDGRTVGTLMAEARSNGWQAISEDAFDFAEEEEDQTSSGGLAFLTPAECAGSNPRPYVIKGLLAQRDVGCVVGAPGVGKSVLAPALAYAVAQGRDVHGRRVQQGSIFYVAAEDEHGMRGRVTALRDQHGDANAFVLVGGVSDLLSEDVQGKGSRDYRALRAAVKERRPTLIVIDTLAMAFPGLEENSAEGMGRVVAVARSLTKWGSAVLLVHHDTKDGANGLPRGHSLLNGALDVSIHLMKAGDGNVRGRLTKNRNGGCDVSLGFTIRAAEVGSDEDGEPVTAALCEPVEAASLEPSARMSPSVAAALAVFNDLLGDREAVPENEWREACTAGRAVSAAESEDSRQKAFRRASQALIRRNVLEFVDGHYRPVSVFQESFDEFDE